jgi:hypothetical protein
MLIEYGIDILVQNAQDSCVSCRVLVDCILIMNRETTLHCIEQYVDEAAAITIDLARTQPELAERVHTNAMLWRELSYRLLGEEAPDTMEILKRHLDAENI